jgi:hypothetical protein
MRGECTLHYWRERNHEVDGFDRKKAGRRLTAIEVKRSGRAGCRRRMGAGQNAYQPARQDATSCRHSSRVSAPCWWAATASRCRAISSAANYIEEWAGNERRHITIRQMLQQSSGIDFPGFPAVIDMTIGDRLEQITFEQGVLAPPDTQFDYTNINPQVLGILLERVSGSSYAEYLSKNLWQHLSDDDATVLLDTEATRTPRTFCCLDTTARAWLRLGLLHLDHGRVGERQLVPEQWMKDIVTPSAQNPNYGYLTWLGSTYEKNRRYNRKSAATAFHSEPFAAPDVIYFDGFGGQRVYIVPSKQLVIVTTGPLRQDWDDALLPNLIIRGMGG